MFLELKKFCKAPLIPHLFFSPYFWYLIGTTKKRTGEWVVFFLSIVVDVSSKWQ
jgi:hypothetical protein